MRPNKHYKLVALVCACIIPCSSCGPHMNIQPAVRPYNQTVPAMPEGTVPTRGRLVTFTSNQAKTNNPLTADATNLANGKIYYQYYCLMCHGEKGDGNGPVGQSYVPIPTDLSSPKIKAMPDGELYKRMLFGVGHDPVLDQTVNPSHRWPIVLYLRTFAKPIK